MILPFFLREHAAPRVLAGEHERFQVDVHHALPLVYVDLGRSFELHRSLAVDQDIDPPELFGREGHERFDLGFLGDVRGERKALYAERSGGFGRLG